MASNTQSRWAVRGATFVLWALVAASAAYWALKLLARPAPALLVAAPRMPAAVDPAAVGRLLGSRPQAVAASAAPSLSSRFALLGVVAGPSQRGAALIAVDGKPARPFRVGSAIDEGLLLQSVQGRSAVLAASSDGPAVLTLDMPPLPK
ncbi:MAG TPA: type II secretion system protein N [Ramlibacter sp.]|nr:type II secretion system protein N [Ramlibacter sp.]